MSCFLFSPIIRKKRPDVTGVPEKNPHLRAILAQGVPTEEARERFEAGFVPGPSNARPRGRMKLIRPPDDPGAADSLSIRMAASHPRLFQAAWRAMRHPYILDLPEVATPGMPCTAENPSRPDRNTPFSPISQRSRQLKSPPKPISWSDLPSRQYGTPGNMALPTTWSSPAVWCSRRHGGRRSDPLMPCCAIAGQSRCRLTI